MTYSGNIALSLKTNYTFFLFICSCKMAANRILDSLYFKIGCLFVLFVMLRSPRLYIPQSHSLYQWKALLQGGLQRLCFMTFGPWCESYGFF